MQTNIEERVKQCVAIQLSTHPEQLHIDVSLAGEYDMDDLDLVEITMAIEDEFGMDIDDNAMNRFETTRQIIDYVTANV
ncbi:acyl carrier protein [Burkholderia pseudomallei]|uniref:acyl carrier protein n=1 Tax=Burkholderia pseudomallei TaxID=28450 RepID=UPI000A19FE7E|nr:acyl carrier protein [Burkholderia pseudomallei]ARL90976.1 hypothetical protein BOC57_34905 [Burkholderia pseudomallei]